MSVKQLDQSVEIYQIKKQMKIKFVSAVLLPLIFTHLSIKAQVPDKGIKWTKGISWQQIKEKAKREKKFIFLDAYTTWCVPCRKMDQEVYINEEVGAFINSNFIAVKVQMDRTSRDSPDIKQWYNSAGQIRRDYKVSVFPTYLFFSPEGEVVHWESGYKSIPTFLSMVNDAKDPKRQYYKLVSNYNSGQIDYVVMPYLIRTAQKLKDKKLLDRLCEDYWRCLGSLNEQSLLTKDNIDFIASNLQSTKSRYFKMIAPNSNKINLIMEQSGYARRFIDSVIVREFVTPFILACGKNEPNWTALNRLIKSHSNESIAERLTLLKKVQWFDGKKDIKLHTKYFVELFRIGGLDTSWVKTDGALNYVAYANIFNYSNDTSQINAAIKWMEGVVRRNISGFRKTATDTYAQLLYKSGRSDEALFWMEGIQDERLLQLDAMKRGRITWLANFSGRWVLDTVESNVGEPGYAVPSEILINQTADSIYLKKYIIDQKAIKNEQIDRLSLSGTRIRSIVPDNHYQEIKFFSNGVDGTGEKKITNLIEFKDALGNKIYTVFEETYQLLLGGRKLLCQIRVKTANCQICHSSAIYKLEN